MAQESENNRKSSRNFSLEKAKKRSFDLEKEPASEAVTPPQPADPVNKAPEGFPEPPDTGKPMKMTWIWVCSVIVLIVIVIACIRGCDSSEKAAQDIAGQPAVEQQVPASDEEESTEASTEEVTDEDAATEVSDKADAGSEATVPDASGMTASAAPSAQATASPASAISGDINAEADKVIRGEYGNGADRKARLGTSYSAVQAAVNSRLGH